MKSSLLGIITVAGLAMTSPAFASGHSGHSGGHASGGHFSGGSSFSAGRSFSPSGGAHFGGSAGFNRSTAGSTFRSNPGYVSARSSIGTARSFTQPGSAHFRSSTGVNRLNTGAALGSNRGSGHSSRSTALRSTQSSARYAATHAPGQSHHQNDGHHHDTHHHGFIGSGFYWPYYSGFYGPYGYGSYYGSGYSYAYDDASLAADVQSALADLGFYRGPIDGILGGGSRRAIAAFQSRNGLRPTGVVDQPLLNALGLN